MGKASLRRGQRIPAGLRHRAFACLALLLVNILLSPLLGARPMTLSGEKGLVICTSQGRVQLGEDDLPGGTPPARDDHLCGYCLPLASPSFLTAPIPAVAPPDRARRLSFQADADPALAPAAHTGGSARGPPALV